MSRDRVKKALSAILSLSMVSGITPVLPNMTAYAALSEINQTIDADSATADIPDTTDSKEVEGIKIEQGGKFRVSYSCESETSMALVLRNSEWSWCQLNSPSESGALGEGVFYADYDYDTMVKDWGSTDFGDLKYICVKTWGRWDDSVGANVSKTATVISVEWIAASEPTIEPTIEPTAEPTIEPTVEPTIEPTGEPTAEPTIEPTAEPTAEPTIEPTIEPTAEPTIEPTIEPTAAPTIELSDKRAYFGKEIKASTEIEGSCEWYRKSSKSGESEKIEGASGKSYTPSEYDLGMYIECRAGDVVSDTVPVFMDESKQETELFSGRVKPKGGFAVPVYISQTGYKFTTEMMEKGGKFIVEYEGDAELKICLSSWSSGKWVELGGRQESGRAEFDTEEIAKEYGEFADLSSIQIKSSNDEAVITKFVFESENTGEVMHVKYYSADGYTTSTSDMTNIGYTFLKHAGGELDGAQIKEDGYFYFVYEGTAADKAYFAFSSCSSDDESKTKGWVRVDPKESGKVKDGVYWCKVSADELREKFGENLARLDKIDYYIGNNVTINSNTAKLFYIDGKGAAVDKDKSTDWSNRRNKDGGIAFIGDDFVEYPLKNSDVGLIRDKGDWNVILGRTDCDNYGISDQTAEHTANRIKDVLDCNYRQLVIMTGINDIDLAVDDELVIERVRASYRKMLDAAKAKQPKDGVFVISMLPSTPSKNCGKQERIAKVNAAIKELCAEYDFVSYVDVYDKFLAAGAVEGCYNSGEPHGDAKYFTDGFHLNAAGYKLIAESLNPMLGGEYSKSEGVSGEAISWDFNTGASDWSYGGKDWSNGGTTEGTLKTDKSCLTVDVKYTSTNWSQFAVTHYSEEGYAVSDKDLLTADVYVEKAAFDKSGGNFLLNSYGSNKEAWEKVFDGSSDIKRDKNNVVTIDGTEYYKNTIVQGIRTNEKKLNSFVLVVVGKYTDFNGKILIDNVALQSSNTETKVIEVSGENNFTDKSGNKEFKLSNGAVRTDCFDNTGNAGRVFKGAALKTKLKYTGKQGFSGTAVLKAILKDADGNTDESGIAYLTSESFGENGEAEIEIAYKEPSIANVKYVTLVMEQGEDGCELEGSIGMESLSVSAGKPTYSTSGKGSKVSSGGGASFAETKVSMPYTWSFGAGQDKWQYGYGWENNYSGALSAYVGHTDGRLSVRADFSKDKAQSWSQFAITRWDDDGMSFKNANHMSMDFFYDPSLQDGDFTVKVYSACGIDGEAAVYPEKAEDVVIEGKPYKKVTLEFKFPPVAKDSASDLAICIAGRYTSYKGLLYLDNITVDKTEDIYVDSTVTAKKGNSRLKIVDGYLKTASGESIKLSSTVKMADKNADKSARNLYAYLEALGKSKDVLFGQQNNLDKKAGNKNLSDADTKDVTGDYAAVFGIDTLSLSGSEYNAKECNSKYGTKFPETVRGNLEGSAYYANKAIENGAIVTMSSHMPNFAHVAEKESSEDLSYARYEFNVYSPGDLSGDVANEILPGGKYNDKFNAYLDMIADYASLIDGAILFRPFHENTGSWFWWGKALCDAETYKNIFRYTHDYLTNEKGVHNLIYVYGPGSEAENTEMYAERYPGDEYVDMVGFDMYNNDPDVNSNWMDEFKKELKVVCDFAREHGKLAAVTETGPANATQEGESQTAFLKQGNKDKDWYNRVLNAVSETDASYLLTWANWGENSGFYTPYVIQKKPNGVLRGHELLDYFINYYNDSRSVFASDQKGVLNGISGIEVQAVTDAATGYIAYPSSGRRVNEPTTFLMRADSAENTELRLKGVDSEVTLKCEAADGRTLKAELDAEQLKALGVSPDGTAELLINGRTVQSIKLIYNMEEPEPKPELVDDFDGYYGVASMLARQWPSNSGTGCAMDASLSQTLKYNGDAALKADYKLVKGGYTGVVTTKEVDWTAYNALQLWIMPDGKNQHTVLQVTTKNESYEFYLEECEEFVNVTEPLLVTVPFSEFVAKNQKGKPKGGLVNDKSAVTSFGLWLNAIENEHMQNDTVTGTIYYDDIRVVTSDSDSLSIVKADAVKSGYADVAEDAWYYKDVMYVTEKGLMSGTGEGRFEPEQSMTRAQLAQTLYNAEGKPETEESKFADVAENAWYHDAVAWAAQNGIVNGVSETEFAPDAVVTREQTALMLRRYAQLKGCDTSRTKALDEFADVSEISEYAKDAIAWASAAGIMNGTDTARLNPKSGSKRSEMAAMLKRFVEMK